jgi:hypothetical protein
MPVGIPFYQGSLFAEHHPIWDRVYDGLEDIPMGSLFHGEDDANGDMNILKSDYLWFNSQIRRTYHNLGNACLIGIALVYAAFALRLNLIADRMIETIIGSHEE